MPPLISLDNVGFAYGSQTVLENISLEIFRGDFVGIVGPNGGGKSTLLKLMLGLLQPQSGKISLLGGTPRQGRAGVGYVPQHAGFARDFPISVEEIVLQGRIGQTRWWWNYRRDDYQIAEQAMREAGVLDLRRRQVAKLSGGQLQRALIARALACQPEILMLDEPTSNIDARAEEDIFDLLKKLGTRMCILVVSHDIGFISRYITRVVCLNRTLLLHQTDPLDSHAIEELYGMPVRAIHHHHIPAAVVSPP